MHLCSPVRQRLLESRWSKWFIALALMQVIVTIPILIVTLVKVETSLTMQEPQTDIKEYLRDKVVRVRIENIWFIIYELWKLWLVIDGILQANSLTVIASAAFTCFSGALGIMQIIESVKWDNSIAVNLYLQIAMTSAVWIIAIPTSFVAFMLFKDYGWNLVERIDMYYTVQCFTLMIKIDIFFEVLLLVFYAVCANMNKSLWGAATALAILSLISLFVGRKAIADEKHWMMSLFSLFQGAIIFVNLAVMVVVTDPTDVWYTLSIYACASIVIVIFTLYMAVRCQRNFGRGLQPHVNWSLYRKPSKTSSTTATGDHNQQQQRHGNHHHRNNRPRQQHNSNDHSISMPPPAPPPHHNDHNNNYNPLRQNLLDNNNSNNNNGNNEDDPPISSTTSSTQVPPSIFTEYYRLNDQSKR
ncbi:hypothetical protein BDA99DRAFT_564822 [Phascolomyces articulosus]|uniref:Uncharacterized protein n=1 Tax=Phascolomyces articulosus TaxID=60185 RepID=A0AAD5P8I6_9FUNG|nr:hypothetical protein BDA99DRAFT_564822 [Phascolomyces articulosus]